MKKRWFVVGIYVLFIYATLPLMRPLVTLLYNTFGKEALGFAINGLFGLIILFFAAFSFKNLRNQKGRTLLSLAILMAGTVMAAGLDAPEERVHFLEYGVLGYLVWRATSKGWSMPFLGSFVVVFIIGGGDEVIQWFLPNRVGDMRDVFMNGFGGLLGISLGRLWNERA